MNAIKTYRSGYNNVARTGNYNKDNDKVFSGSFMVLGILWEVNIFGITLEN